MDFTSYASRSSDSQLNLSTTKTTKNYDHILDPYIRRYHITKIILKSMSYALITHITKSIIQNISNRKFYKMSPWLELCVGMGVFSISMFDKFQSIGIDKEQLLALTIFRQGHLLNSQYYH